MLFNRPCCTSNRGLTWPDAAQIQTVRSCPITLQTNQIRSTALIPVSMQFGLKPRDSGGPITERNGERVENRQPKRKARKNMPRGRGKDGLHKRGTFYSFRYKDSDGVWREKHCGTANREEARTFRDDFLSDIKAGTLPNEMGDWRLGTAENWWVEFRKLRT